MLLVFIFLFLYFVFCILQFVSHTGAIIKLIAYWVLSNEISFIWTNILLYHSINQWYVHTPHVEFANSVWCPFKLGDIKEIEKNPKKGN